MASGSEAGPRGPRAASPVFQGGMYWLVLLDDYSASFGLMVVVVTTCLAVTRVYGERPGGRAAVCPGSLVPEATVSGGGGQPGWRRAGGWATLALPRAGIQRFCRDIHMMLGFKPGLYFRACWLFLSPATLLVTGGGREGCWLGAGGGRERCWLGARGGGRGAGGGGRGPPGHLRGVVGLPGPRGGLCRG